MTLLVRSSTTEQQCFHWADGEVLNVASFPAGADAKVQAMCTVDS